MAQASGTFDTYDSARNRETFADLIAMISPEETPFQSLIGTQDLEGTHPEWSTDPLGTPVTTNAQIEGDEYSYTAPAATTRVGNYTQIARKAYIISRTHEIVAKAGKKSELGRERAKKGLELRQDIEVQMLSNTASVAGSSAAARVSGGLRAWLATNDSMGATGASGGFSAGLVTAATNGTQRAFTKAIMDDVILNTYNAGGTPTVWLTSPYVKTVFSTFMSDANVAAFRTAQTGKKQGTIYGAADVYVSNFGPLDVIPNRQMARTGAAVARNAFLITPNMVTKGVLRPISEDKVARTGDAEKRVLITEYALIVKNEAAHGVAADLFGLTAAS
ncbi:MAG TPA: DUF5309 domain-containing protein [Beijerinckiaceae bacterium]|nr:DUF5309 domain-containing protein [Beijerinckiaceae bacterium]